jgi:hypothetical protein
MSKIAISDDKATAVWTVALRLQAFSYSALAAETHTEIKVISQLVRGWHRAGVILDDGLGKGGKRLWKVAPNATLPVRPVVIGTVHGNLWRSMQLLKAFCPTDLMAHSSTDETRVTVEDASAYCQTLNRAGYLRVTRKAVPGQREAIYRLIRDTGPKPPVLRRIRAVFDQNLGEIVYTAGAMS